jgi:hypothetical protein
MGWTTRRAAAELELSGDLCERLPAVGDAMAAGRIDLPRARVIAAETVPLDPVRARQVAAGALRDCAPEVQVGAGSAVPLWTTGQLRHRLRRRVLAAGGPTAEERSRCAIAGRTVSLQGLDDGLAELTARLPAGEAAVAWSVVESAARRAATPGDTRTIGQRRADALVDLLLGRDRHGGAEGPVPGLRTVVNVTVPATAILPSLGAGPLRSRGAAPVPQPEVGEVGEIEGIGPVAAGVVRRMVDELISHPGTTLRAIVVDAVTGEFLAAGSRHYRPPPGLAEHIRMRDRTCRFPGCRRSAAICDLDHTRPWPAGSTSPCNLSCLCRRHHRLKQQPAWTVTSRHGVATWTAPTGHTYTSHPEPWLDPVPEGLPGEPPPESDRGPDPHESGWSSEWMGTGSG